MTRAGLTNLAASVHRRLLNLSQTRGENFNLLLVQYALERFLYRLVQSGYAHQFVLKGALLFVIWRLKEHRPTRDLDLLGYGDSSPEVLDRLFRNICAVEAEDGLIFHPDSVRVREIREEQEYGGQRVHLVATLGQARIPLQIDIGFGDAITPAAEEVEYPTLLGFPALRLRAYPKETVVAEKLQSMVMLGILNSRMKDFYDIWALSQQFPFDGRILAQAIRATLERRRTELPQTPPVALTPQFAQEPSKITQWKAFLRRNQLDVGGADLAQIVDLLGHFLLPPLAAIADGRGFAGRWPPGGPWVVGAD
jgi:predicted nucleotidyltransferase component of viral defense system